MRPGAARLAEVGEPGADHAHVVDAAVLVEARVLDGEHGVLHHLRDLVDRHEVAALLAELAEQHAVGREHAHRQLRPVVGQAADLGQIRIGDGQGDAGEQRRPRRRRTRRGRASRAGRSAAGPRSQRGRPSPAAGLRRGRASRSTPAVGVGHDVSCIERSHYRNRPCRRLREAPSARLGESMQWTLPNRVAR